MSPSSGCAGGLVAPKLIGATKPPAHPEEGTELVPKTT